MIAVALLLAFLGSLGLAVHLVLNGEFLDGFKAIFASLGLFTLLALRIGFFRITHER